MNYADIFSFLKLFKLWCHDYPSRQEIFANFISRKLAKKQGAKILEVGGGRTGRLSRILSSKGFKMTCIDPKLEVKSCEGVEFIKGKFNFKNSDLSSYDYVIAQEPCEATEHVVRACVSQNVPFMRVLCGGPHTLISGKKPKDVYEWYDYLENIAKDKVKIWYPDINPLYETPIIRSNKF